MTRSQMVSDCRRRPCPVGDRVGDYCWLSRWCPGRRRSTTVSTVAGFVEPAAATRTHGPTRTPDAADAVRHPPGKPLSRTKSGAGQMPTARRPGPDPDRIPTQDRRSGGTDRPRPAWTGLDASETADHFRNTTGPQWTNRERRLIYVSAGQPPLDVARPKGLEPPTF